MTYDLETIARAIPNEDKFRFLQSFNSKIQNNEGIFPGFHAVTLLKRHIPNLIENDYLACEKSDGTRALLYIMSYYGQSFGFLIDRKLEVFQIFKINQIDLECDYVFDGEFLITKDNKPTFTIFDTIFYQTYLVVNLSLLERLDLARKMTRVLSQLFHFEVTTKMMYKSYGFAEAYHTRESLAHECDGLIFTKVYAPYVYGTCPVLYKWKPPHLNTIDFLIKYIGDGTYSLLCLGKNKYYIRIGYFFYSFIEEQKKNDNLQKQEGNSDPRQKLTTESSEATLNGNESGKINKLQSQERFHTKRNMGLPKKETILTHKSNKECSNMSPDIEHKRRKGQSIVDVTQCEDNITHDMLSGDHSFQKNTNKTINQEEGSEFIEKIPLKFIEKTNQKTPILNIEHIESEMNAGSEFIEKNKPKNRKDTSQNGQELGKNNVNQDIDPYEDLLSSCSQECSDQWSFYDNKIGEFRFNVDLQSIDIDDDFSLINGAWELLRIRQDKETPNSVKVVANIFLSMEENITYEMLCSNFKEMRKQWKKREEKKK